MKQGKYIGYDGKELKTYIFEAEKPRGIVQIAHGLQQNSKVFFDFAKFLNKKNFIVALMDLRSHGKSCKKLSEIGKCDGNVFSQTVNDEIGFSTELCTKYPNLPLYFIGFSYGSLIGQEYLKHIKIASKIILVGSTYFHDLKFLCGAVIAKTTKLFKGKDVHAKMLEDGMQSLFSRKFSDKNWNTTDEKQTQEINKDILNIVPFSAGFYDNLFDNRFSLYHGLRKINKDFPIGIFCGGDDPFCGFGKGAFRLYNLYKKKGLNVKINIYPQMRHSILHETNKELVYNDILNFILLKI